MNGVVYGAKSKENKADEGDYFNLLNRFCKFSHPIKV
jgi:hypothetical protein